MSPFRAILSVNYHKDIHFGLLIFSVLLVLSSLSCNKKLPNTEKPDFRVNLLDQGIPDSYVPQKTITDQAEANNIASEYFTSVYLPNNGIPFGFISQFEAPTTQKEADNIALKYFTEIYLPSKGVPLNEISSSPVTLEQANSAAEIYFLEKYLPSRGIPLAYILEIQEPPISDLMADAIARGYFSLDLISRGIPESYVLSKEVELTSLASTDEIAREFFKLTLLSGGTPLPHIETYYELLLSQSISDEVQELWLEEVAITEEANLLIADIETLQSQITTQQLAKLNQLQLELNNELADQIVISEQELSVKLEAELAAIERELYLCSGAGFVPLYGDIRDLQDAIQGHDSCTGEQLALWEQILNLFSIFGFVDLLKAADRTLELFDSVKTINEFFRLARSSEDVQAINRIIDTATIYGRGDEIVHYVELLRQLERTDDLNTLRQAANEFSNSEEFLAVVSAIESLKGTGLLDLAILPSYRAAVLHDLRLDLTLNTFRNSPRYEIIMALIYDIEDLPKIDNLANAANYLTNQRSVTRLTNAEKVLRTIGGLDTIDNLIQFLQQGDVFRIMTNQLQNWEDYINFVHYFSPRAKSGLWRDRALVFLEGGYLSHFVAKQIKQQMLVYVAEISEDNEFNSQEPTTTAWVIKTYDPIEESSITLNIENELRILSELLKEGGTFSYFFDSQPSADIINLIETSGGEVYWSPDNLP